MGVRDEISCQDSSVRTCVINYALERTQKLQIRKLVPDLEDTLPQSMRDTFLTVRHASEDLHHVG